MSLTDTRLRISDGVRGVATFYLDSVAGTVAWSGDAIGVLNCDGEGPRSLEALLALLQPDARASLLSSLQAGSGKSADFAVECRIGDRDERWTLLRGTILKGGDRDIRELVGVAIDITAQKRAERALHQAQFQADLALRAGYAGFWAVDLATGNLDADQRARAMFRLPDGPVHNEDIFARIHPDDRARRRQALDRALAAEGDGQYAVEFRIAARDDLPELWVDSRGQVDVVDGKPRRLVGVVRDISARKRAEELLAESKQRLESRVVERTRQLEAIVASAVSAILTINSVGAIQTANKATTKLFGYGLDELIGRNVRLLMPERYSVEHDQYIRNYVETGHAKIIGIGREVTGRRKDGSTFPLHLAVSEFEDDGRRYFTGIITDLTDRDATEKALRDSQSRLAQAQKLEAIGQLTGGVAHDFNNLLTVITGNLELLDMRLQDEVGRDLVRRADEAARMGARLTERLLTFSRRRKLQPTVVNLNDVALGMLELLRRALGETIRVDANLAPDLWNAKIDASEIENAILNLAINGRDAMPGGGRILIETSNMRLTNADATEFGELAAGDYVKLSVSDNGFGMSSEVASRAFEPFFTTKETGRGTGLGLSTIYGFVKQSGGEARIYSEVGKGTAVSLYLPRDQSAQSMEVIAETAPVPAALSVETILVVEDNDEVRDLTVRRLHALGYDTLVAENGPAAIALLQGTASIDLVFSDVVMPGGMSGFDIARWAKANAPALTVLLTSGFAPEVVLADSDPSFDTPLLRKPYTQAELARAIRGALRGR